jgi:hypothetical protein
MPSGAENGDNVLIYVSGNSVGGQRNVTLNVESTEIDSTAKGDTARTYLTGRPSYTLELDGVYLNGNTAYDAISTAIANKTTVTVNRYRGGSWVASATAYVTSLSRGHPDAEVATYNISMLVSGGWSSNL